MAEYTYNSIQEIFSFKENYSKQKIKEQKNCQFN